MGRMSRPLLFRARERATSVASRRLAVRAESCLVAPGVGANACPVSLGGIDEVRLDCSARLIPWPNMDSWIGFDTLGHNCHPVALLPLQESPAIPTKTGDYFPPIY